MIRKFILGVLAALTLGGAAAVTAAPATAEAQPYYRHGPRGYYGRPVIVRRGYYGPRYGYRPYRRFYGPRPYYGRRYYGGPRRFYGARGYYGPRRGYYGRRW